MLRQFYYPQTAKKEGSLPASGVSAQRRVGEDGESAPDKELQIHMFNDNIMLNEKPLELDALNEKFFMYVFKALLYTENRRILYYLLDVVNFYVTQKTNY